jgi:hypothetical protein
MACVNPVKFATCTAVCIDWLMGLWLIEVSAHEMTAADFTFHSWIIFTTTVHHSMRTLDKMLFLAANDEKLRTSIQLPLFLVIRQNLWQHLCQHLLIPKFSAKIFLAISLFTFCSYVVIYTVNRLSGQTKFHIRSHPILL